VPVTHTPALGAISSLSNDALQVSAAVDPVQALRDATQALHTLPLARPADAAQSLRHYHDHLRVLHGWLLDLAPALERSSWGRGHIVALRADLADAGLAGEPAGQGEPPAGGGTGQAWGLAYVVEGSQLGGRVLYQRLRRAGVTAPLRYLEGRGPGTGAHWNSFLHALRAALVAPDDVAAACAGACWAFEDLLARFRRHGWVA
jgi:heme oxygenase